MDIFLCQQEPLDFRKSERSNVSWTTLTSASWTRSRLPTLPTTLTSKQLWEILRGDLGGILRFSGLVRVFVEMEVLCRSQSGGAAFCSIMELCVAEIALSVEKTLLSLLLAMVSSSTQTASLVEGPDAIYRILRKSKDEVAPENKDAGDSDEDEEDDEDDNEQDEDQEDDDGAEDDPSGDENDNPEANGEGGNQEEDDNGDDDDDDDDSDEDEEEDEDEEDEEEDEEDDLPQPPAKKRK